MKHVALLRSATGHPVRHFDRIDSTNAEARRLAEVGERGPLWLWADEQTGGRGRLGRNWVSEPGNLYATLLFSIAARPEVAAQVSFVAALAVHDMVMALRPELAPCIKWPNDVLIGGAKFCGVLPEVVGSDLTRIAIGCGVNVAHAPKGMPYPVTWLNASSQHHSSVRHPSEGWGPASSGIPAFAGMTEQKLTVESVLQELASSLSIRLKIWDEGRGFSGIRQAWGERALGLGGKVTALQGAKEIHGIFTGLAADGALILTAASGAVTQIHSGEVKFAALEAIRKETLRK